jgi:hypothetical protein
MFLTNDVDKTQNTRYFKFFSRYLAVYEIKWKNKPELRRPQMTI